MTRMPWIEDQGLCEECGGITCFCEQCLQITKGLRLCSQCWMERMEKLMNPIGLVQGEVNAKD